MVVFGRQKAWHSQPVATRRNVRTGSRILLLCIMLTLLVLASWMTGSFGLSETSKYTTYSSSSDKCNSETRGYHCRPEISHHWGQYSPFFSVQSEIPDVIPPGCSIDFAQALSRHGARDPTASKTTKYNQTIAKIHANVKSYPKIYDFLADYEYTLGADQLTPFGQQEMINSGAAFYERYRALARDHTPFIRSSGEARVVESAQNFSQGFHVAKSSGRNTHSDDFPYSILVIPETAQTNNTLNHGLCTAFEDGPDSDIAANAQAIWASKFVPPIQTRLNNDLVGADLTLTDVIYLMDLCPFNTVASRIGAISPFCDLFTEAEWHQYDYYETLNKYYGYSYGNPLGPTQGVGFANELIARLTDTPVVDHTSTNHTLDSNPSTFPLPVTLAADFSHDNDMTAILSALGLYAGVPALPNTTVVAASHARGYSAAWTVPFAARVYFERMTCLNHRESLVRVIVNDRVLPLTQCDADALGRCRLSAFVDSLSFARSGGLWDQCFPQNS